MTVQELVSAEQFKQLETIVPVDFEKLSDIPSRDGTPFVVGVDARPLAVLIRSAARACRVYELMAINRPGDVLNYLWLTSVKMPSGRSRAISAALIDGPT